MPRAEVGTPKWVANKMKSKGLQRLRWYCQVCEKQCRDENGFKCHIQSEGHLRQMLVVGENAGKHIADYSSQFQSEFMALLSQRFGTKRVKANTVYQEYIQDKHHIHMNATRWVTLAGFVKHLGRSGRARVDETDKGWFIAWIDNSPRTLAKQEAALKKARLTMSDEQRERLLISDQIERAKTISNPTEPEEALEKSPEEGLKRNENTETLSLSLKFTASTHHGKPVLMPNPLRKLNASKTAPSKEAPNANEVQHSRKRPLCALESIIYEEEAERKRRKMQQQGRM